MLVVSSRWTTSWESWHYANLSSCNSLPAYSIGSVSRRAKCGFDLENNRNRGAMFILAFRPGPDVFGLLLFLTMATSFRKVAGRQDGKYVVQSSETSILSFQDTHPLTLQT